MSRQDSPRTGTSLGSVQLSRHEPVYTLGQEWTWHFSPSPSNAQGFAHWCGQVCLLSPSPRQPRFSRGSLPQGVRQEEGNYINYGPDAPFPKAAVSHRSRLGVSRLDACSRRKRIVTGAVPSPRSIPQPLLPRSPGVLPGAAPACLHRTVSRAGGPGGSGERAKQLPSHLQRLVEGELHLPFLVSL